MIGTMQELGIVAAGSTPGFLGTWYACRRGRQHGTYCLPFPLTFLCLADNLQHGRWPDETRRPLRLLCRLHDKALSACMRMRRPLAMEHPGSD